MFNGTSKSQWQYFKNSSFFNLTFLTLVNNKIGKILACKDVLKTFFAITD